MFSDSKWPVCTSEELKWESSDFDSVPRHRRRQLSLPYSATVTPQIAEVDAIPIGGAFAAALADAESQIARFDERIGTRLSGFAVIALRTEAASSSLIENLTASASSIAIAEHATPSAGPHRPNAELISANVATLQASMNEQGPLGHKDIIEIQRILLAGSAPHLTGKFRDEAVWVGGDHYSPHGATHVAPHHDRVPAAIDDLVAFVDRTDLGGLAHIAVAHAQFETIHPFPDGNGRTGRVIVQRMLRNAGLTTQTVLPVSSGLLADTDRYFAALVAYQAGDIKPIVETFVGAAFASINNATRLADDLEEVRAECAARITARSSSSIWRVLDYCLGRPAITAASLKADTGVSTATAHRLVGQLEDAGVLHQNSKAKRNRVWLVSDVITAVEAFMERAIRRTGPQRRP